MSADDQCPVDFAFGPLSQNKDEAFLELSIGWSELNQPPKNKTVLEKILQRWANTNNLNVNCIVLDASADAALISVAPATGLKEFEELCGQTLTSKDKNSTVTVRNLKQRPPQTHRDYALMNLPPSFDRQEEKGQLVEPSQFSSSTAGWSAAEQTRHCSVPVAHYWYVNHIYKEEMNRIEKKNGVKITAEVMIRFEPNQENGHPRRALEDFTNLVQTSLTESNGFVVPLKNMGPDGFRDVLRVIQKNENKLLVTLSSEEVTVCGPSPSQEAIKESLHTTQNTITNDPPITMSTKDPILDTGLTIEKQHWIMIKSSYKDRLSSIETKYNVNFIEVGIRQEKVEVNAVCRDHARNPAMETDAVRDLHRLNQAIVTSAMTFTQSQDVSGFKNSTEGDSFQFEGASGGPQPNGKSEYSTDRCQQTTGTSEDDKDEICPICMDTFINKKQLEKCKHEFCEQCLKNSEACYGPKCPVCRDVFGLVEGDQPDGKMSWRKELYPLPGFPHCGVIVINYNIPSGIQTKKHPKPGERYSGARRTAYLPDNREGNEVLQLLKRAFDQRLIFTVGTSRTTGQENQVTWNDVHHKTCTAGGPQSFGYPDPNYLSRVRDELKAKGIE